MICQDFFEVVGDHDEVGRHGDEFLDLATSMTACFKNIMMSQKYHD